METHQWCDREFYPENSKNIYILVEASWGIKFWKTSWKQADQNRDFCELYKISHSLICKNIFLVLAVDNFLSPFLTCLLHSFLVALLRLYGRFSHIDIILPKGCYQTKWAYTPQCCGSRQPGLGPKSTPA